jgi:serine palmitoyltransferase
MGLHVLGDWDSPVIPIMVYHIGLLATLSRMLYSRHIAMVVVGFPATPLLLCRCRVCISASHTREDLDYALDAIRDLVRAAGLDYANKGGGGGGLRGAWRRWAKGGFRLRLIPDGLLAGGRPHAGKGVVAAVAAAGPASRRSSDGASSSCSGGGGAGDGGSSCSSSSGSVSAETSRASSVAGSWGSGVVVADEKLLVGPKEAAALACIPAVVPAAIKAAVA